MRAIVARGPAFTAAILAGFALVLGGCASQVDSDVVACPEPRPQVCTLEYAPACGTDEAGRRQEFSSPCNACASEGIVSYESGPCPE